MVEFDQIKTEYGKNSFAMSPTQWIKRTNAIGIVSKGGRYSIGTYAHPDIAFEFASWLSPEFKLYLITEFERLKTNEAYQEKIDWQANRILSKLNYVVHTDAVKNYIVPTLTEEQKKFVYAEEADVLNVALFGMTAKEWRENNSELAKNGNIRDYTDLLHLVILNNLQNIFKRNPVVMMYPGRYETKKAMTLRLFDRLDDDNYYRAFPLVERRLSK